MYGKIILQVEKLVIDPYLKYLKHTKFAVQVSLINLGSSPVKFLFLRMKSLLASWHLSCWISEAFLSSRDIDRFKKLQMQKTKIRCLRNGRTVTVGNMIVRIPEVLEEQYWPLESPDGSQKRRDYRLTFFFFKRNTVSFTASSSQMSVQYLATGYQH